MAGLKDSEIKAFDYPLNGRLITKLDPVLLPEAHFQTLQNFRYNDGGIEPILGMSKNNASAFAYTKVKGGFHFKKEVPSQESHIFAQTTSGANSKILKSDNSVVVPGQDSFTSFIPFPTNDYVNFSEAPDQSMMMCDGYTNYVYSGNEYRIAKLINYDPDGTFSYDYSIIANNNLTDAENVFTLVSSDDGNAYVYIGSTRPISGIKFYIKTANASAATVAVNYWSGTAFAGVASLSDGTATAGKTLSKTGIISFTSTVGLCKVKAINENVAYYYRVIFDGIEAGGTMTISQVAVVCPAQPLADIWDGSPRQIFSFIRYFGGVYNIYSDMTLNAYKLDYYASAATTYIQLGFFPLGDYIYVGFNERLLGFKFFFGETNVNMSTATITVEYWNGSAWVTVGTVNDSTSVGGVSFNRSGTVTWNAADYKSENITSVGNSAQWFYYRIYFSAQLSASIHVDNVTGIPAQVTLRPYRFPVLWQNRLWLLNDQSEAKNTGVGSSYGTVCVFNGIDSPKLTFGGTQEVVCAAPLFTRYGGSIYENLVVCKRNQTYLVDGTSPENYIVYKTANTIGCIAPQTMKVCDTGYEVAPGLTKHVVVWLSASGVVMFDANSIINISSDISDRFDPSNANYINLAVSNLFTAFYDARKFEYHIMIATGSSATLNEEWVYDLTRRKWYQIVRGAKYLTCGFEVEDIIGNKFVYGGTDDGFLERLETGATFDGVAITSKFRLPDGTIDKSCMYVKEVRRVKLTGKTSTTTAKITVRHYADGSMASSVPVIASIDQNVTGKRIFQASRSLSVRGVFHSFEFEATVSDVQGGFNPLFVSGLYRVIREDLSE
jgi:hypothetical protein